jgi:hypothetical protein
MDRFLLGAFLFVLIQPAFANPDSWDPNDEPGYQLGKRDFVMQRK